MTLTHKQIDSMKSEELPAAVAAHVMGWKMLKDTKTIIRAVLYKWDGDDEGSWVIDTRGDFHPQDDANHALRVAEKIHRLGFDIKIYFGGRWVCSIAEDFAVDRFKDAIFEGKGDTIGIAICRAALHSIVELSHK